MRTTTTESTSGLLIVAGHAIWNGAHWIGGFPGEDPFYAAHVEQGLALLKQHGYDYLVFSGGRTRPKLEFETKNRTEAEGMKNYAMQQGLLSANEEKVILENWARDCMENLFFSLLAFHKKTGEWPTRVGVVSWNSKGLRFHLIAAGLRLGGKIFFHGVGDYPQQHDLERACAAEARFIATLVDVNFVPPSYKLVDPLLRNIDEFAKKRWARMPNTFSPDAAGDRLYMEQVKLEYSTNSESVQNLIDQVHCLTPGDSWRHLDFPWHL